MDIREQFGKAEVAIGINMDNYHHKFVYDPSNNNDNFLLPRFAATPSQL